MQSTDERAIRVLLVEDNPGDALLVEESLAEARGASFAVTHVTRLRDAEERLKLEAFDVVLLDLSLPDATELEGLVRIQFVAPRVPVVVLTGLASETAALRAVQQGAQDYLVKEGFYGTVLVRSLRYAVERTHARQALEASEQRFRALMENALDVVTVVDADGIITYKSPSVEAELGWVPGELVGTSLFDLVHTDDRAPLVTRLAEIIGDKQEIPSFDVRVRHRDGSWRTMEARCRDLLEDPAIAGIVINSRDITERTRAEADLRASEEKFRLIAHNVRDVFWIFDPDFTTLIYASPQYEQLWGRSLEDLNANPQSFLEGVHPDDLPAVRKGLASIRHGVVEAEYRLNLPDGSVRWVRSKGFPVLDEDGQVYRVVGTTEDITDRREADEELRRSEERFSKVFRNAPVGIMLTTAEDGVILDVNDRFLQWSGYERSDLIDRTADEVGLWADPADQATIMEALGSEAPDGVTIHLATKDGDIRIVEFHSDTLDVDGNEPVITLFQDVTERIGLQTELQMAQRMEAVGRLAGGIAHDFNNLITAIRGHAEFLLEGIEEGGASSDDAEEIRRNADRAADLTRQLLAFSRQQVLHPRVLDAGELIRDTEGLLQRLIGEDVEFTVSIAEELGRIEADPGQFEQVLVNLCVNARDAMPGGGRLTVNARNMDVHGTHDRWPEVPAGPFIMLEVTDTGTGIDHETLDHIFDPFFTTKEQGKGTGLGLSTVYGTIKQSGGYIYCESDVGTGTTFTTFLPRVDAAAVAAPRSAQHEPDTASTRGAEVVLLVEDETSVRNLARRVLERQGYTVLAAEGPTDALNRILPEHPDTIDLLITDVVMPEMSGRALAERVKQLRPEIRTMYMSGYTQDEVVQRGIVAGGAAFVEKPFTPRSLATQVRQLLDATSAGPSS